MSNRKELCTGYKLRFNNKEYVIEKEIGKGGSCIVYDARYWDNENQEHFVKIKECYPNNTDIIREKNGSLKASSSHEKKFNEDKAYFIEAYKRNVSIKNELGLGNSTVTPIDIYNYNNTYYIVTTCDEGKDYRNFSDSMQSVLKILLALSDVIKKYHNKGILHLDIKPENILIVPETKERVILYDFDSLIRKEDLSMGKIHKIPYSEGYSAPELCMRNIKKICEATDIYSIGVILFHKIFDKMPSAKERAYDGSEYLDNIKKTDIYISKQYPYEFYKQLSCFFCKTVNVHIHKRYQNMDDVLDALNKLLKLSEKNEFLVSNFDYYNFNFIVRQNELKNQLDTLKELDNSFENRNIIFLTGNAGIGKTELAQQYAYEKKEDYDNILFVPFEESVVKTICGENLYIKNVKREQQESERKYFERKLVLLNKLASEKDLIILDNVFIENDVEEDLARLFDCKCKFLVTSCQEGWEDWNYKTINLNIISNGLDDTMFLDLFESGSEISYTIEQQKEILTPIIEILEYNTLLISLVAKYFKKMKKAPKEFLEHIMEKECIESVEKIPFPLDKNREQYEKRMIKHLQILFDLSEFSEEEKELIISLSLFDSVYISRKLFLKLCRIPNNEKHLNTLIDRGWIEYNKGMDKIVLPQLILKFIHISMTPNAENCYHIVFEMIEYIEQDIENDIEKISKINLIEHFVKNINDNKNQELYVELCYTYATSELCRKVKDIEYFHSKIEKIYQSDTGKSEDIAYFYDEISKKMKEFSIDESIDKSIDNYINGYTVNNKKNEYEDYFDYYFNHGFKEQYKPIEKQIEEYEYEKEEDSTVSNLAKKCIHIAYDAYYWYDFNIGIYAYAVFGVKEEGFSVEKEVIEQILDISKKFLNKAIDYILQIPEKVVMNNVELKEILNKCKQLNDEIANVAKYRYIFYKDNPQEIIYYILNNIIEHRTIKEYIGIDDIKEEEIPNNFLYYSEIADYQDLDSYASKDKGYKAVQTLQDKAVENYSQYSEDRYISNALNDIKKGDYQSALEYMEFLLFEELKWYDSNNGYLYKMNSFIEKNSATIEEYKQLIKKYHNLNEQELEQKFLYKLCKFYYSLYAEYEEKNIKYMKENTKLIIPKIITLEDRNK